MNDALVMPIRAQPIDSVEMTQEVPKHFSIRARACAYMCRSVLPLMRHLNTIRYLGWICEHYCIIRASLVAVFQQDISGGCLWRCRDPPATQVFFRSLTCCPWRLECPTPSPSSLAKNSRRSMR